MQHCHRVWMTRPLLEFTYKLFKQWTGEVVCKIQLESNHRRKIKYPQMKRNQATHPKNQWLKEEITRGIREYLEESESETPHTKTYDADKAV